MSADFLRTIDWGRPWLAPFQELGRRLASSADWRGLANELVQGTRNARGDQIRFVPQASLPSGMAYEAFIAETGMVPTRENLHDFFNALVWLTFPNVKVRLNTRQASEIRAAGGIREVRGKVRDAATLFDENAALLVLRDAELLDDLRAHRWQEVFLAKRSQFQICAEVILFGHALMEKLVTPYKAITAHAWPVVVDERYFAQPPGGRIAHLDALLAAALSGSLEPGSFTPLPVLGIPGWWDRQDLGFYSDQDVFRPKRQPAQRPR